MNPDARRFEIASNPARATDGGHLMNAAQTMTRSVITVAEDTPVIDAARLMIDYRTSGLPVVNAAGQLVGIVTEGDLLRRVENGTEKPSTAWAGLFAPGRAADAYARSHGRKVGEVMTRGVEYVASHTPLSEVVRLMETHHIKRLPVVDEDKVVGIISRADLLRAFLHSVGAEKPSEALTDSQIQSQLLSSIRRQPWAPWVTIGVAVKGGVCELAGTVTDDRTRRALRVLCENTPGIASVTDHMICIEPMSGAVAEDWATQ
jgi:CBS domain-containing protein